MPLAVIVSVGAGEHGFPAAAVEGVDDLPFHHVQPDEVGVLGVGHVEHHALGSQRLELQAELGADAEAAGQLVVLLATGGLSAEPLAVHHALARILGVDWQSTLVGIHWGWRTGR